jgi:preprotein translocase subunit SecA
MLKLCSLTFKIKTFESSLIALTHDELRARTAFKEKNKMNRAESMLKLQLLKLKLKELKILTKRRVL